MAKRRITRKQIKQKDQFLTRAEKLTIWITEQGWKKVTLALFLVAIILLLFIFVNKVFGVKQEEASTAYSKALAVYVGATQPVAGQFIENKEMLEKALKEFDTIIDQYGSSISGQMAAYMRVQCLFKLGQNDKAFKDGEELFNDVSEDLVKNLVGLYLYDKYIDVEKYKDARRIVSELEDDANSMMNMNQVYYLSGRLYELENQKDKAVAEYMKVLKNQDLFYYKTEAQQRISQLDPKALEEARKTEE